MKITLLKIEICLRLIEQWSYWKNLIEVSIIFVLTNF